MSVHSSHVTRISDASSFDEICVNCGAHDTIGGFGNLVYPCPNPPEKNGESKESPKGNQESQSQTT